MSNACLLAVPVLLFTILPVGAAAQTYSWQDSAEQRDTLFNEIRLSESGVTAVDTFDVEWNYDFETNQFVRGAAPTGRAGEVSRSGEDVDADLLPIEERCTELRKVRPWEKSILIGVDEYVDGNIIAFGQVRIKGWVKGDVKSLRKRVLVTETGQVDGDIEAPSIIVKDGGVVLGRIIEQRDAIDFEDIAETFSVDGLIVVASLGALLLMVAFLSVSLMPKQISTIRNCILTYKLRTFFLGWLCIFLMPVVALLLTITIIGLILVPFLPLAYLASFFLGIVVFGILLGQTISSRFISGERSILFQALLGILLYIGMWFFVAILMGSADPVSEGFGIALLVFSIVVSIIPISSGLGAVLLTRFGFKDYIGWKGTGKDKEETTDIPAPPPIPNVPDSSGSPGEKPSI